jgi:hypothetical protein
MHEVVHPRVLFYIMFFMVKIMDRDIGLKKVMPSHIVLKMVFSNRIDFKSFSSKLLHERQI